MALRGFVSKHSVVTKDMESVTKISPVFLIGELDGAHSIDGVLGCIDHSNPPVGYLV
jgi:hypothetical protein